MCRIRLCNKFETPAVYIVSCAYHIDSTGVWSIHTFTIFKYHLENVMRWDSTYNVSGVFCILCRGYHIESTVVWSIHAILISQILFRDCHTLG